MNLFSIKHPDRPYQGAWGSVGIQLNRHDALLLALHLLASLALGHKWVELHWKLCGKPGGWKRVADSHPKPPRRRYLGDGRWLHEYD